MPTIVYEGPDEEIERKPDELNFDDTTGHWRFPIGEDADGDTVYRRIPRERVYHVDRTVGTGSISSSSP
jgi:hypothetical protein